MYDGLHDHDDHHVRVNILHDYGHVHDDRDRDDHVHYLIFFHFFNLNGSRSILFSSLPILHSICQESENLALFLRILSYFYRYQKTLLSIGSFHQVNYNCRLLRYHVSLFIMFFLHVSGYDCIYHEIHFVNDYDHENVHDHVRNRLIKNEEFS